MINLLFAGNEKVFDGILTGLLSIMKRTETKEPFKIHVYTMDVSHIKKEFTPISDELISFLNTVVKDFNHANEVIKVDVTDIYMQEFSGCPNENSYVSPYALLRTLADLVPNMPDKLLYLDIDLLFNKDITLLYNIDVSDYEYAAARDHYGKFLIYPNYINSGVLLLNLAKIKETRLFEKARDWLRKKKLMFVDQSAIIRSTTKRLMLKQRFNDQKFLYKNTVIRHFSKRLLWLPYPHTANIKQWHIEKVYKVFKYHQFDDIYELYNDYKRKYLEIRGVKNEK